PISRAADSNEWRNHLRDVVLGREPAPAIKLAPDQVQILTPQDFCFVGAVLLWGGRMDDAVALLRDAQQRHPDDFSINYMLAGALERKQPPAPDEVVRFYSAALTLRPGDAACIYNLGRALLNNGRPDEALAYFRKAIELEPDWLMAHIELGAALAKVG